MSTTRLARQPPRQPPAALLVAAPRRLERLRADFQERRVGAAEPYRAAPDEAFAVERHGRRALEDGLGRVAGQRRGDLVGLEVAVADARGRGPARGQWSGAGSAGRF